MKPVFLIGYMGCGKTTLGEVLARQMGVRYIDLDELIETRQGMSTVRIFEELGEPRFRELEIQTLQDSAEMTDVIIGTGGGTPCHGENMALMNRAGITVWLTTSPERITARLLLPEQKCKRPKICHLPDEALLSMVEANCGPAHRITIRLRCNSTPPTSRLPKPPNAPPVAWRRCCRSSGRRPPRDQ